MRKNFYIPLEGFRGLSVLLVLVSHFVIISNFPKLIPLNLGFLGVNFFFVLSGFLISEILIRQIETQSAGKVLKIFYSRRVLRIFPLYYLVVFLLIIFNVGGIKSSSPWLLTYTMNIGTVWNKQSFPPVFHFWSLCVEEQFYLFWPLLLVIFKKKRIYLFISVIFLSILLKVIYLKYGFVNPKGFIHDSTFAAMDALAFGALLAELKRSKKNSLKKILNYWLLPIIFLVLFWFMLFIYHEYSSFYNFFGRLTASIVAFYLVGWGAMSVRNIFTKAMMFKPFVYLGKISYGIYVYHMILYYLLINRFNVYWGSIKHYFSIFQYQKWFFVFIFFSTITFIIASISFYFFEKPFLKLKNKIK